MNRYILLNKRNSHNRLYMYMKPIKVEKHFNEFLIKTHIHCGICLSYKLKIEEYFYMQIPDASIWVFT